MRTTKLYIAIISLLALGAIQAGAVDYKNHYSGAVGYSSAINYQTPSPAVSFHSTSTYSSSWANEQPMLNVDGSVNAEAYMGPRKGPGSGPGGESGSSPGTPGGPLDPTTQQPLGDAVLPLLLMLLTFACVRCARRMHHAQNK